MTPYEKIEELTSETQGTQSIKEWQNLIRELDNIK